MQAGFRYRQGPFRQWVIPCMSESVCESEWISDASGWLCGLLIDWLIGWVCEWALEEWVSEGVSEGVIQSISLSVG